MRHIETLNEKQITRLTGDKWSIMSYLTFADADTFPLTAKFAFCQALDTISDHGSAVTFDETGTHAAIRVQVEGEPLPAIYHALSLVWDSLDAAKVNPYDFLGDIELGDDNSGLYYDVADVANTAIDTVHLIRDMDTIADLPGFLPTQSW